MNEYLIQKNGKNGVLIIAFFSKHLNDAQENVLNPDL